MRRAKQVSDGWQIETVAAVTSHKAVLTRDLTRSVTPSKCDVSRHFAQLGRDQLPVHYRLN